MPPISEEGEIDVTVLQAHAVPGQPAQPAPDAPVLAPVGPDHLAGGVLRSLSRNFRGHYSWGVVTTLLVGGMSFGLLPLLRWTQQFHRFVRLERQQLWHLAEWLRLQTPHPDAVTLPQETEKIRWRGLLAAAAILWIGAVAIIFAYELWTYAGGHASSPLRQLISWTYGFRSAPAKTRANLFGLWNVCLFVAYALHWLHVQLHAGDVRRFVEKLNRIAEWEGAQPLSLPRMGPGAHPLWLLGALALVLTGALWGVPLMLAGAVQRRYISRTSARVRAEAAECVRTILLLRRPVLRVPPFARPTILCRGERCRAPIPLLARFCARCGARAGMVIADVA